MSQRSFKVVLPRASGSVLHAKSPANAAKKASKECSRKKCEVVVQDRKSGKKYKYRVTRTYDPITVKRGGRKVTFDYTISAKSLNKSMKRKGMKSKSR
jgi:hypothetical protein